MTQLAPSPRVVRVNVMRSLAHDLVAAVEDWRRQTDNRAGLGFSGSLTPQVATLFFSTTAQLPISLLTLLTSFARRNGGTVAIVGQWLADNLGVICEAEIKAVA